MVLRIILLFGSGFTRNFSIGLFSTSKTADADRLLPVRSTFFIINSSLFRTKDIIKIDHPLV